MVFNDAHMEELAFGASTTASKVRPTSSTNSATVGSTSSSLRELDVNVVAQDAASTTPTENVPTAMPPLKKQNTNGSSHGGPYSAESKLPMKKGARMTVAGVGLSVGDRENLPVSMNFSASVGQGGGRKLRSHENG
jgi:kinesin family protein 11